MISKLSRAIVKEQWYNTYPCITRHVGHIRTVCSRAQTDLFLCGSTRTVQYTKSKKSGFKVNTAYFLKSDMGCMSLSVDAVVGQEGLRN